MRTRRHRWAGALATGLAFLVAATFVATSAAADSSWRISRTPEASPVARVTRDRGFENWTHFRLSAKRREARTEVIRARAASLKSRWVADEDRRRAAAAARSPEGERTLGRACIYGRSNEVLYAPPGRDC